MVVDSAALTQLLDGTTELVCAADADGWITYVNRAWRETLGYSAAEAAGLRLDDVVAPEHRACYASTAARRLAEGEAVDDLEAVLLTRDGRRIVCRGRAEPVMAGTPEARRCVGTRAYYRELAAQHEAEVRGARLLAMHDASADLVGTAAPDGRIEYLNAAGRRTLGLADDADVTTLRAATFLPPATLERLTVEGLPTAARDGRWTGDGAVLGADGVETPVSMVVVAHPSLRPGEPPHFSAVLRDVSERRRAERRSADQAAVLEMIAAGKAMPEVLAAVARLVEREAPGARCAVLRLDGDGRRLRHGAAPSLPDAFTAAVDGLVVGPGACTCGAAAFHRLPVVTEDIATDARWAPFRDAALAAGLRACWATPLLAPDGAVLGTFAVYRGAPGRPSDAHAPLIGAATHLLGIALERARAEQALVRGARYVRALIEHASDLMAVVDTDGVYRYVSPAHHRHLAYAPTALIGRDALALVHPDDAARVAAAFAEARATSGRTARVQYRFRHGDGSWRTLSSVGTNLLDDPAVAGVVVNSVDVTEQQALEAQLRQAQRMEAVGRLAGGVAHDINNLLTIISANTEFALRALPDVSPARPDLTAVAGAAARAAGLTRQLLNFSRRQVLRPEAVDLNAVVEDVARLLHRTLGADVALATDLAPGLGPVQADRGQLEQVLMNLVVNARDAMPAGGTITVTTGRERVDGRDAARRPGLSAGRYVALRVRDTGLGMDAATQAQIFEPFFTTKDLGQGTGLGLATVYDIAMQSGGHVYVDSAPGAGSTFTVLLPGGGAAVPPPPFAAADAELAVECGAVQGGAARGTILLVEDEAPIRGFVRRILDRGGYHVLEAGDGRAALRVAAAYQGPLHLVLTDVAMPEAGGEALLAGLRERRPSTRALLMSGYSVAAVARQGALAEGVGLLQKPFTADELLRAVREALGG
ncbi:hybrid sensor histidine kinase/response regulator [Roseisolibacter agri]|uniref:hybrid sensor histidine kinase/response regulator n=1 Tax=Roseisolibacter agri TaxID=2014610 RepID=UPI0024E0EB08|nr:PAS domain S-box protein [Roseisolibacter agri]